MFFGQCSRSWAFAINDIQLELDEQRENTESLFDNEGDTEVHPSGQFFSMRVGGERNVTLTLPDGRRTTFYYYLEPAQCTGGDAVSLCASPKWVAGPGVFASLGLINDVKLSVLPWSNGLEWWTDDGSSKPENYEFGGYVLTNRDGTEYWIEREDKGEKFFVLAETNANYAHVYGKARLSQIKSRTQDTINFTGGIYGNTQFNIEHRDPSGLLTRKVICKRNEDGFISEISDPNGLDANGNPSGPPVLKYDYAGENLIRVHRLVDKVTTNYQITTYGYTNRAFPHYITSITDPRGITVARNLYDTDGRLVGMIDADGRTNRFVHDLANRHEIVINRKGYSTTNVYDIFGNVTNVINALGATNHFHYDTNGFLLSSIDPLGNTTTFSNDARGNVLTVTLPYAAGADPAKYTTRYTHDMFENRTSTTLPTGGIITNKFDTLGNLTEIRDGAGNIISTNAYDANGLLVAEGDQFGALKFGYDVSGNVIRMTNTLGQVTESGYDANGQLTNLVDEGVSSSFQYDPQGRDTFANYGNGITLSNSYNSQLDWNRVDGPTIGHMERRFDSHGRLSGWTTPNGSQPAFAYDDNGQMQFETNSIGAVSKNVYDAAGHVIAATNLATGAGMTYAYDLGGRRVAETNALGQITRFEYNPDGSLKSMTNAFGTNVWSYSYDSGAGCCGGGGASTTVTDPLGRVNEDIRTTQGLPSKIIRRTSPGATGANAATNTMTYLTGLTTPQQEAEEYPATITDEGGRTRQFGYSAVGQLVRATDSSGSNWWTNQYNGTSGALTNVVSPTGARTAYAYDGLDNVLSIQFADNGKLTNYYAPDNNRLVGVLLPSGTLLTNFYDFAGRVTNTQARISTNMTEEVHFGYNLNDAVMLMTDNTGTTINIYDAAGRLIGIDYPTGANVRYGLDLLGRITSITNRASQWGAPYVSRYAYDAIGNITNVTDPWGGQTSLQYDRVGRRTKRTLPNGVTTEWQYNWKDQVTNIVHKTSNETLLASAAYERAPGGEPTRITREDNSYVLLQYDAALRLTNEVFYSSGGTALGTSGYGYDASGTRIRLVTGGVSFTNAVTAGFRMTEVKTNGTLVETYSYDGGGRITNIVRGGTTLKLGYNAADQLTAVTNGSAWTKYSHDGAGRRTKATDQAGTERRYLVAPTPGTDLQSPHIVSDTNNFLKQGYVYIGNQPLLRYDGSAASSRVYYLEDANGSVIGLAPDAGPGTDNTTRLFYDGFGNSRATNGPTPNPPAGTGGDFRFHGAWLEVDSRLYHMRARDYDSRTARFLSRDPDPGRFAVPETLHPYAYANNNPAVYSDPSGTTFTLIEVTVVGAKQTSLQTFRTIVINRAKKKITDTIVDAFSEATVNTLAHFYPGADQLIGIFREGADVFQSGINHENQVLDRLCNVLPGNIGSYLYIAPLLRANGEAVGDGFHCPPKGLNLGAQRGFARPDFIFGEVRPTEAGAKNGFSVFVGELKLSGNSLYNQYVIGTRHTQFEALVNYAGKSTYTRSVVFITVFSGERGKITQVSSRLRGKGLKKGVLLFIFSGVKNKKF